MFNISMMTLRAYRIDYCCNLLYFTINLYKIMDRGFYKNSSQNLQELSTISMSILKIQTTGLNDPPFSI